MKRLLLTLRATSLPLALTLAMGCAPWFANREFTYWEGSKQDAIACVEDVGKSAPMWGETWVRFGQARDGGWFGDTYFIRLGHVYPTRQDPSAGYLRTVDVVTVDVLENRRLKINAKSYHVIATKINPAGSHFPRPPGKAAENLVTKIEELCALPGQS